MAARINNIEDWNNLLCLATGGDDVAQYEVGTHYDYGQVVAETEIVAENKSTAFEWYYKAYQNGNNEAIIRVADFLSEGIYCEPDIELAIELYKRRVENGSGIAANNLATVYRDRQDYENAFELYKIAQKLGKSNSLQLALCHYFGIGTEKNIKTAHEILLEISRDSPKLNNSQYEIDEANYLLGRIYLDGIVVERSIQQAINFLTLANTDSDHRSAQQLLLVIGKNS